MHQHFFRTLVRLLLFPLLIGDFTLLAGELKNAQQLLAERRFDEAEHAYRALLDGAAGSQAAMELAAFYEQLGEIDAAAEAYTKAIENGTFSSFELQRLQSRLDACKRQRPSLVRFPVSVEAETDIKQIEAAIQAKQWVFAFNGLQTALDKFNGTFLQRGPGQYLGIGRWAELALQVLSVEGLNAYAQWSQNAWQRAIQDGSDPAMRAFAGDHPAPSVFQTALLNWADQLADGGEPARAVALLSRPGVSDAEAGPRLARWQSTATRRPAQAPLNQTAATLLQKLDQGMVLPQAGEDEQPSIGLAADDDRLYVLADNCVEAFDVKANRSLWVYAPVEPVDRRNVSRDIYGKPQEPRQKWAGALDIPALVLCPAGLLVVERYVRDDREQLTSTLTCLDPDSGAARWRLDRDPTFRRLGVCGDPVYSGGAVLVTVVSRGEFPEFWLCALSSDDGRLLWRQRIAVGATPTRCIGRGVVHAGRSGPTLAADHETIYYATQMGAVVAVDRDLGRPIWATSYPRISRIGPITSFPLPLLERRTEPIQITRKYLVILPRDLNGLLVIDRAGGQIVRMIRLLDLIGLIHADDERAVVLTSSGDLRCLTISDGTAAWSWRAPAASPPPRPLVVHGELLVFHGRLCTRLDLLTGKQLDQRTINEAGELRLAQPAGEPVFIGQRAIRLLNRQGGIDPHPPERPFILGKGSRAHAGWSYEAYFPGGIDGVSRFCGSPEQPLLIHADAGLLEARSVADQYRRLWDIRCDAANGRWAVEQPGRGPSADRFLLAISNDGHDLNVHDAVSGRLVATGNVNPATPIRWLGVAKQTVLVAGTSTIAGVQVASAAEPNRPAELQLVWQRDFSPRVFEQIEAGSLTLVLLQPGDGQPAMLERLDSETGKPSAPFIVAAPRPFDPTPDKEGDSAQFDVERLSYRQEDLLKQAGGWVVKAGNGTVAVDPGPVRVLGRSADHMFIEIMDYGAMLDLNTGEMTILAPQRIHAKSGSFTPNEQLLRSWVAAHRNLGRDDDPSFTSDGPVIRYNWEDCTWQAGPQSISCGSLTAGDGGRVPLAALEPEYVDELGDRILIDGRRGTLVLRRSSAQPAPDPSSTRSEPVDMFDPRGVKATFTDRLMLDGDLSDWPEKGWLPLRSWASEPRASAVFQWGVDRNGYWLAVRVTPLNANSGDNSAWNEPPQLLVLISQQPWDPPKKDEPLPPIYRMEFNIRFAQDVGIGSVRDLDNTMTLAMPFSQTDLFDLWLRRRYRTSASIHDGVVFAAEQESNLITYEVRLARGLLAGTSPNGFDLRIIGEGPQGDSLCLSWCGALLDPISFPPAQLISGEPDHEQ